MYYDISKMNVAEVFSAGENNLFEFAFQVDINEKIHTRKVYTIFQLLKEAGGIMLALKFLPSLILSPLSNHSMIISASKEIFSLHEKDAKLIHDCQQEEAHMRKDGKYNIHYSFWTSFQIFLIEQNDIFTRCIKNGKKKKKVIQKTRQIVNQQTDIRSLIKNTMVKL